MEKSVSLPLLASGQEISQCWLEKVLSHKLATDMKISSWTVKSPETREGFLSEIRFVRVLYSPSKGMKQEANLVVKLLPQTASELQVVKGGQLAKREVEFYRYTSSEAFITFCQKSGLDNPVPDVFWADSTDDKVTIILQDLTANGFKLFVVPEGNSLVEMKCILRSVAAVHAAGVGSNQVCQLKVLGNPFDPKYFEELVTSGLQMQIELFEGTPTATSLMSLKKFPLEMIETWQRHPLIHTIVHGDLWTPNAMFSADKNWACIFDWQFAYIGNPMADIATLLLCSGDPCVYNDYLMDVLGCYWETFDQALKNNNILLDISFEDMLHNLEKMWMHGFMVASAWTTCNMENGKITKERVRAVASFLEKRGVFNNFLKSLQ